MMYHKNCLSGYALKFKLEDELIMRDNDDIENECTKTIIKNLLISKDLATGAYHLSDLCEEFIRHLTS